MTRFNTDFVTWLKGLFYTETEVDTLLNKKVSNVDVQGRITNFTNKDRINNERLTQYVTNSNKYICIHNGTASFSGLTKLGITNSSTSTIYISASGLTLSNSITCNIKLIDGTLLGTGTWDSSNSRFSYTVDGSVLKTGIHYIYAECTISDFVWKTNILSVFVKDTTNLLSYNLWSGSEYENKTTGIIPNGVTITPSNKFSSIGESSFKIIRTGTNNYLSIDIKSLLTNNKSYTVYMDIYSLTTEGNIGLRDADGSNTVSYSVGEGIQTVSVTKTFTLSGSCYIQLTCSTGPVFIDNIRLVESE